MAGSDSFRITRPGLLIALALVTALAGLGAAWKLSRRRAPAPPPIALRTDPNSKPPQIIDTKDAPGPLPIGATFGRIEIHPRAGAGWLLAADDAVAGDLLVAPESAGFQVRDRGDVVLRGGSRLRAWLGAAGPILVLEQGEVALDTRGAIELRVSGVSIRATSDAAFSARISTAVSVACIRGRVEVAGSAVEADSIAEVRNGAVAVTRQEVAALFQWIEEARAPKKR